MALTPRDALVRALVRNFGQALRRADLSAAREVLQRLQHEEPVSLETRGSELELLIAEARLSEAETLAAQLVAQHPGSARIHALAGELAYRRKLYAKAIEHFGEAERLHPHWRLRLWLGRAQTQNGDYAAAERLLLDVARDHKQARIALAWLYERRGERQRAIRELEDYVVRFPDESYAQAQLLRLRASVASPEDLVEEVATLRELGEEIAPEMLPAYIQGLLETGRGADARRFVDENLAAWNPTTAGRVAWAAYRLQAYDLALRLFLAGLPAGHQDFKYLAALEAAARHCHREADIIAAYRPLAASNPNLFGRIRVLARRVG